MAEIMLLGDTHGDKAAYLEALEFCKDYKIKHVFLLGDCGLFPYYSDTQDYVDAVNKVSRANNIVNWWVRGNHDDTGAWQAAIDYWPGPHGTGKLRSHINLLPRTRYFKHFGLDFLAVGGAVSIDKQWRLKSERAPRTLWWPDEAISDQDVANVLRHEQKVDILLSHECSNYTPWNGRLKPDLDSQIDRQRLDTIIRATRPELHFHGHMHTKYEWDNYVVHGMNHNTQTFGLQCNKEAMDNYEARDNYLVLDTVTKHVTWKSTYVEREWNADH